MNKAYQLKISIKDSHPPIWRRVVVPSGLTFSQLAIILIEAMGWSGYHLWSFEFYHRKLELIEKDDMFGLEPSYGRDVADATLACIDELMESEKWFTFIYDFGDYWEHRVEIEQVIEDYEYNYPKVIKYKGDCPPEDIGGIWAYQQYLKGGIDALLEERGYSKDGEDAEYIREDLVMKFEYNEYEVGYTNEKLKNTYHVTYGEQESRSARILFDEALMYGKGFIATKNPSKIDIIKYKPSQADLSFLLKCLTDFK